MEIIESKDIIHILRKTLNLIDDRLIHHGERVSYILYKMLQFESSLDVNKQIPIILAGILHDIGAYKNEELDKMIQFETKNVWGHSIYGYLFLKYLSPLDDIAEIVLYHHLDYTKLKDINCSYKSISSYINLADRIDVNLMNSGTLHIDNLTRYKDIKFSEQALDLFQKANSKYNIIDHILDDSYLDELNTVLEQAVFTRKQKDMFLTMLIYSIDFRSEFTVLHTITTVSIADYIGRLMGLKKQELMTLHYGALLHDIGKISTPISILESPRGLTSDEMKIMKDHVVISELILKDYIRKDILEIAIRHHEKLDGTGYPKGLKSNDLTLPQRILAVADIISALCGKRSYKDSFDKDKILAIIQKEADKNKICPVVVDCVLHNFDSLMNHVNCETNQPIKIYSEIKNKYNEYLDYFIELDDKNC